MGSVLNIIKIAIAIAADAPEIIADVEAILLLVQKAAGASKVIAPPAVVKEAPQSK